MWNHWFMEDEYEIHVVDLNDFLESLDDTKHTIRTSDVRLSQEFLRGFDSACDYFKEHYSQVLLELESKSKDYDLN